MYTNRVFCVIFIVQRFIEAESYWLVNGPTSFGNLTGLILFNGLLQREDSQIERALFYFQKNNFQHNDNKQVNMVEVDVKAFLMVQPTI